MMRRNVYSTCDVPLSTSKKYVAVHLLTLETLYFVVEVKSKVSELFNEICKYLGLVESQLFGLSIATDDSSGFIFLDPSVKLSKHAPKQWKLQNNGVDCAGKSLFSVHFRVQFYVDSYLFISDRVAKLLYYLQLRENVVNYGQALCEERAFLLASYSLQADFGNFDPEKHQHGQYFNPHHYFPSWVIEQIGLDYITRHLPFLHRDLKGMDKVEAQSMYIKEASDAIAPHNLHLYKLKSKKASGEVWLGTCPNGVEIYSEEERISNNNTRVKYKTRLSLFKWSDIGKLYFEKKKFEIHSVSYPVRKFAYYAGSEEAARHLLWLCRVTHQFQLIMQPKMREVKRREQELCRKRFRESYVYCDSYEFPIIGRNKKRSAGSDASESPSVGEETGTQRVSVISNASSNTTSGIVSDKVQSLEDSDRDDIDIEMMLNSPPVASLESLTLSEPVNGVHLSEMPTSTSQLEPQLLAIDSAEESKQVKSQVHSSANSTKSTSSEQSNTTIKSAIQPNAIASTVRVIEINTNNSNDYRKVLTAKNQVENERQQSSSGFTSPVQQKRTNSRAIISQLPINDLSVKLIDVSTFSKLSERSESMNHIYENIPYFSHFNQTPKKSSPPPPPTSAPFLRITTNNDVSSLTRALNKQTLLAYKQNKHIANGPVAGSEPNLYNNLKIWSSPYLQSNFFSLPLNGNANLWNSTCPYTRSTENIQQKVFTSPAFDPHPETRANCDLRQFQAAPLTKSQSPPAFVHLSSNGTGSVFGGQRVAECIPQSFHQSLNDIAITSVHSMRQVGSEMNINSLPIFIPPPPDYANSCSQINLADKLHSLRPKESDFLKNKITLNGRINSAGQIDRQNNSGSITDLNQLRQKSRDLDLPLITALFNDRSLMVQPKSAPTASKQRQAVTRDTRRFSCSYENDSLATSNCNIKSKLGSELLEQNASNRPTSWHLDLPNNNILWDNFNFQQQKLQNNFSTTDFIERIWAEHQLTS